MDFRQILFPNDLTIYAGKLVTSAGYLSANSTVNQIITEGEPQFAIIFDQVSLNTSFNIDGTRTKFYPTETGVYNISIVVDTSITLPQEAITTLCAYVYLIRVYDKDDVILKESIEGIQYLYSGLTYFGTRNTITTNLLYNFPEGSYISIIAYPAQSGIQNFSVLTIACNLFINYIGS